MTYPHKHNQVHCDYRTLKILAIYHQVLIFCLLEIEYVVWYCLVLCSLPPIKQHDPDVNNFDRLNNTNILISIRKYLYKQNLCIFVYYVVTFINKFWH